MATVHPALFRLHYANLKPERNNPAMYASVRDTLEALNTRGPHAQFIEVQIPEGRIQLGHLGMQEKKVFMQFVKKYAQKADLSEEQTVTLVEKLPHYDRNAEEIKKTLLLRMPPIAGAQGQDKVSEAKNRISDFISAELTLARNTNNEIRQSRLNGKVFGGILAAVSLAGLAMMIPMGIFLIGPWAALFLLSVIPLIGSITLLGKRSSKSIVLDHSLQKIAQLEHYKKLVTEPEFAAFINNPLHEYDRLKNRADTFYRFLDRYVQLKKHLGDPDFDAFINDPANQYGRLKETNLAQFIKLFELQKLHKAALDMAQGAIGMMDQEDQAEMAKERAKLHLKRIDLAQVAPVNAARQALGLNPIM